MTREDRGDTDYRLTPQSDVTSDLAPSTCSLLSGRVTKVRPYQIMIQSLSGRTNHVISGVHGRELSLLKIHATFSWKAEEEM